MNNVKVCDDLWILKIMLMSESEVDFVIYFVINYVSLEMMQTENLSK